MNSKDRFDLVFPGKGENPNPALAYFAKGIGTTAEAIKTDAVLAGKRDGWIMIILPVLLTFGLITLMLFMSLTKLRDSTNVFSQILFWLTVVIPPAVGFLVLYLAYPGYAFREYSQYDRSREAVEKFCTLMKILELSGNVQSEVDQERMRTLVQDELRNLKSEQANNRREWQETRSDMVKVECEKVGLELQGEFDELHELASLFWELGPIEKYRPKLSIAA